MKKSSYAVQVVKDAQFDIVRSRKSLASYGRMLKSVSKDITNVIKAICPEPVGEPWDGNEYSITCRVDGTYCKPSVNIYLHNLDGFKDERLENILAFFNDLDGLNRTDSSEYAVALNRTFRFSFSLFDVRIDATVKSDSPTCRKVVVKTELVKKDIYAIQCD